MWRPLARRNLRRVIRLRCLRVVRLLDLEEDLRRPPEELDELLVEFDVEDDKNVSSGFKLPS